MVILACLVVVIAGLRAASGIVVPILLALFLSMLCAGPFAWLRARKVPAPIAIFLVVSFIVAIFTAFGIYIGMALNDFLQELPGYKARVLSMLDAASGWFMRYGINVPRRLVDYFDPTAVMQIFANILSGLGNIITWFFLVMFTTIFVLMESQTFLAKIRAVFTKKSPFLLDTLGFVFQCIRRYLAIKTWISLATGATVMLWLMAIGVDYAILWGILAFLLHYIPNIGSLIAAFPAVLFALVDAGLTTALLAVIGYSTANLVFGNILEPIYMGRGLSLSTLVVFLSLVFWGWVLGPIGMLLSAPMTMVFKIAFESFPSTRWISTLLDADSPLPVDFPHTGMNGGRR